VLLLFLLWLNKNKAFNFTAFIFHQKYKVQKDMSERKMHGSCSFIRNYPLRKVLLFLNSKNYISHEPLSEQG